MKVLRVINSLEMGGAERSIVTNLPYHIKNGYTVDVLLLDGKYTIFHEELKKHDVNIISLGNNINIYNPIIAFKLIGFIKKYDIVHGHLFPVLYWLSLAKILSNSKSCGDR